MLYVDIPTRTDLERLATARHPLSVSAYLPTSPLSQDVPAFKIELKNLAKTALDQVGEAGADKRQIRRLQEEYDELVEDDVFWSRLAHSLAIFATPDGISTYRLPNRLTSVVEVADRFLLKPLFRSVTFPQTAYLLALSQGAVRLFEVTPELPPQELKVPGMPRDVASWVGKSSIADRAPIGKVQGSEGQKLRMTQYARGVDAAVRSVAAGSGLPLVLASLEPMDSIYRGINTYPHLLETSIPGNPEAATIADLSEAVRGVLDAHYAQEVAELRAGFADARTAGRASTDITDIARAATFGAVGTLFMDIDEVIPGFVDDQTGVVTLAAGEDAASYGVVDEIARRAFLAGARIYAVRRGDIPEEASVAAILRYAV
jgi:hypothetical protein